jgi:hypothetical protein
MLRKKSYLFRRITTLSLAEFHTLAEKLEPEWKEREADRLHRRTRVNKIGQGRPYEIGDFSDLLLATLIFMRTSIGIEFLGLLFGVNRTTVQRAVERIIPLLQDRFIPRTDVTKRKRRTNDIDEILREYPELEEIIVDGTELPIKRPKKRQKQSYSGKKKRQTKKSQIALDKKTKLIVGVSPPRRGKIHDKRQLEEIGWDKKLADHVRRSGDLGYLGMEGWKVPHKKPRKRELTKKQKRENRQFSKERIVVEHGIRGMKIFRRIGETITAKTDEFLYTTVLAAANLYNFKRLMRQGLG